MGTHERQKSEIALIELLSVIWSRKAIVLTIGLISAVLGAVYEMTKPSVAKISLTLAPADISKTMEVKAFNASVADLSSPSMLWAYGDVFAKFPTNITELKLALPTIEEDEFEDHFALILADREGIQTSWNTVAANTSAGSDYQYLVVPSLSSARLVVTGPKVETAEQLARSLAATISEGVAERTIVEFDNIIETGIAKLENNIILLNEINDLIQEANRSSWAEVMEAQKRTLADASSQVETEAGSFTASKTMLALLNIQESFHLYKELEVQSAFLAKEIARLESMDIQQEVRALLAETPLVTDAQRTAVEIKHFSRQAAKFPFSMSLLAGLAGLFVGLTYVIFGHFIRRPTSGT